MDDLICLILKLPRETEVTPIAALNFFSALIGINKRGGLQKFFGKGNKPISFEIVLSNQGIHFQIVAHKELVEFIESQLKSSYPNINIQKTKISKADSNTMIGKIVLKHGSYYPIKTFPAFSEVDSISSLLSVFSSASSVDTAAVQFVVESISSSWQTNTESYAAHGVKKEDGSYIPRSDQQVIKEKVKHPGFKISIRFMTNNDSLLSKIVQSFRVYTRPDGNSFTVKKPMSLMKNKWIKAFNERVVDDNQILNIEELATLWHLPSEKIKTTGITWGMEILSDPPATCLCLWISKACHFVINLKIGKEV